MRVAVLGAGPAGLAAAWRLTQDGHEVTVFEREGRVGVVTLNRPKVLNALNAANTLTMGLSDARHVVDKVATMTELVDIAKPLGIAIHDHIIVGRQGHASFKALKLI